MNNDGPGKILVVDDVRRERTPPRGSADCAGTKVVSAGDGHESFMVVDEQPDLMSGCVSDSTRTRGRVTTFSVLPPPTDLAQVLYGPTRS
jgi:hypothetical protein